MALGWSFAWRVIVLNIPMTLALQEIPTANPVEHLLVSTAQLVGTILCFFGGAHWLRNRGFGSVRVILVEWAEYQKATRLSVEQVVQPMAPPRAGPRVSQGVGPK